MKHDEFAFFNRQLAGMLEQGIPLEAGLRRLCQTMRRGTLQTEFAKWEADLAKGVPLGQSLAARKLPELYVHMVQVGAQTHDLPGVLTLLADYYQRTNAVWTRLQGIMVYPVIVLGLAFVLSLWISFTSDALLGEMHKFGALRNPRLNEIMAPQRSQLWASMKMPPIVVTCACCLAAIGLSAPRARRFWQWRVPAFREARLAQFAAAMHLLLKQGCALPQALGLAQQLEQKTAAGKDIDRWRQRCAEGYVKWLDLSAGATVFPPLFHSLVASAGEDLPAGFRRASQFYLERADYRTEVLLYAALPVSLLILGLMIMAQIYPAMVIFFNLAPMFRSM